jgi:cytoskeleton protein RodZ
MPTVAEQLRLGREAMKLDIAQVVEATKLKADQVRALEEGDYDSFSAGVYLRGSVRTYANLLKLDTPKLIAQLETELGSSTKFADELPAPARKKSGVDSLMLLLSRLNWTVAAAVIVLLALVLGANASWRAWKNRTAADPLKKLGAGMYQPAEPAGEILPLPTNLGINVKPQIPNTK